MILIAEQMHSTLMKALEAKQIEFDYRPEIELAEVLQTIAGYDGIVVRSKFFIDQNFMEQAPGLRFIARAGSGTDNIDSGYAENRGIKILNSPEALCDAVAEHTIGLILALQHKIAAGNAQVKGKIWDREANRGVELMNSTVGIIGYGHTGSAVAKKLQGFGVDVLAYDKYKIPTQTPDGKIFFDSHATFCPLISIYEKSDILTLHVPLTPETRMWIDKKFFDQFKKPIIFINTSRGKIVNTPALIDALEKGKVKGAGLDVIDPEPPFDQTEDTDGLFDKLIAMDNVVLTPHVAGWSVQSYERISFVLSEKIIEFYTKLGR